MQNNDCEKALKFLFSTTLSAPYARFRIEMKESFFLYTCIDLHKAVYG